MYNTNIETGKITIEKLIERDGNTCYICGIRTSKEGGCYDPKYPNIEHVHPRSLGGEDAWYNVKVACRDCNVRKNNIPLEEFLKRKNIKREIKVTLKDNYDNVRGEVAKHFEDEINSLKKALKSDELIIEKLEKDMKIEEALVESQRMVIKANREYIEYLSKSNELYVSQECKNIATTDKLTSKNNRLQEENNKLKKELEKYKNMNINIEDGEIDVEDRRFTTIKFTFKNKEVKYNSVSVGYEEAEKLFESFTKDDMDSLMADAKKDIGSELIRVEIDGGNILWEQDSTPKKVKGFFSKILK